MNVPAIKPRTLVLILSGITLVGIALRLYHLNYQSLWYDELHSIIPTDPDNSVSSIVEYSKRDQPPGYFLFLHFFFQAFGYNEIVGRLASVLLGAIAIPVMYFLGKEVRGERSGIAAAAFTSLNYMHIYYSQELRFYTMVFLTTALSFLFLIRAFKNGKNLDFFAYVLSTAALMYSHYYGLVIFAVQMIAFFMLIIYKKDKSFIVKSLISGLVIVVLFIPWLPVIFSDLQIASFWISKPEPTFLADYFYYYFGKDAITTVIFVFLIVLSIKGSLGRDEQNRIRKAVYLILIVWLVFSYLIPYLKSVMGTPMLYVRYTIVALPAWIIIISIGWDLIRNERLKYGLIIVVSLVMILNLIFFRGHYVRIDKQQFREASSLVKEKNTVYPVYSMYAWHYNFYFRDDSLRVQDLDVTNPPNENYFWLLQAEFFSPKEKTEVLQNLQRQFEIVETHSFHKTDAVLLKKTGQ